MYIVREGIAHLNWLVKEPWHRRIARGVFATPPIVPRDDGVVLFSMIGTKVLAPYLVAVKSLHAHLGRGRVVLLDDGTLTDGDRAVLAHHLGSPLILPIGAVDTGPCPRGGTWERLLTILDLRARDYVVQLDSDTVTMGAIPEVEAAIAAGRSFTLLGEGDAAAMPADAFTASRPPADPSSPATHVQPAAEAVMDRVAIPGLPHPRYVRGCSGFAGFASGAGGRALAEAFSVEMDRLIGRRQWDRWGSEQVASNFVIANDPGSVTLPYARYFNFWNDGVPSDARFGHFIGESRFWGRAYLDATRDAIRMLR